MTEFQYRCSRCGRTYGRDEVRYLCPDCGRDYAPGMPLRGVLEVDLDYAAIARRFEPRPARLGPLLRRRARATIPAYPAGGNAFRPGRRGWASAWAWPKLWIKNDGLNPSGSLKDRASFLVVAEAARLGEKTIVCASTGNAASSLAAVCAAAGRAGRHLRPRDRRPGPSSSRCSSAAPASFRCAAATTTPSGCRSSTRALRGGLNRNTAYHPADHRGQEDRRPGDLRPERDAGSRRHPRAGRGRRHHQRRLQGLLRPARRRAHRPPAAARGRAGRVFGRDPPLHRRRKLPAGARPRDHRRLDLGLRAQQPRPGPPGRARERRLLADGQRREDHGRPGAAGRPGGRLRRAGRGGRCRRPPLR